MKIKNKEIKQQLIQRLHRIDGQIHGIESMLEAERDCSEILQQLAAIQSAMQSTSRTFLQEYATACLLDIDEEAGKLTEDELRARRAKIVQEMLSVFNKAP